MTRETARLALQFLERLDLKGVEVPAFVQVFNELKAAASAPDPKPEPEAPKDG